MMSLLQRIDRDAEQFIAEIDEKIARLKSVKMPNAKGRAFIKSCIKTMRSSKKHWQKYLRENMETG